MKQERINCIESSQEHLGWKILLHHFIKVCEIQSVIHSSVKYKNETGLGRGEMHFINFCQNDPVFPIYDVMLLEQLMALNLLASSMQISVTLLAERRRNKIMLL